MTPCLNWLELEILLRKIGAQAEGLFVDRIIIPQREKFPSGYLKGEWAIRLTGRRQEGVLLISIRPRHPYIAWQEGKGAKASPQATRSPFDLALSKHLKGSKLLECKTLPRERTLTLWFSGENARLGLILVFIPAAPEALLVSVPHPPTSSNSGWPILARSRTIRDEKTASSLYFPPDGSQAPAQPTVREELIQDLSSYFEQIEKELENEAFSLRVQTAEKSLKHLIKQAQERYRQSETASKEAEKEQDWQRLGDLLKGALGQAHLESSPSKTSISVLDYETGSLVQVPRDPKLSLQEQTSKFYQNARRKQRRTEEAQIRMNRFQEVITRLENGLTWKPKDGDWNSLSKLERLAGQQGPTAAASTHTSNDRKKSSHTAWLGKSFLSKDGLVIWVGRSKDENLELTFKHARGNDLWMHIRGRPGAHVVIPLSAGKSAPLETLLDAATLAIFYSGGANWGKTEVDYTFKKYVKRIKDSTEASYTHNKTLLVEPDLDRRNRLLSQNA